MYKDSILIRRNIAFLIFQFFLPVIQIALACLCIGHEPSNLSFGIVNNETLLNSSNTKGSIMYVDELNNSTFDKIYLNWLEAYTMTKQGKIWGFVDLSANFTQDTIDKFSGLTPSNQTLLGSNVNVYLDTTSNLLISRFL